MKLLTSMTIASVPVLVLCVGLVPAEVGEARPQLEEELAIYGTVMRPGTREPVPGAQVRLLGPNATFSDLANSKKTVQSATGVDGQFSFEGLAPGRYSLGLVPTPDEGSVSVGMSLEFQVQLNAGELPPFMELWTPPSNQILAGRVLGPGGGGLSGVCVGLMRPVWFSGQRYLSRNVRTSGPCETNDEGQFALTVAPGEYSLRALTDKGSFTYYPGVANPALAAPVFVREGLDMPGMDVRISDEPLYRARFKVELPEFLPGVPEPLSAYTNDQTALLAVWLRRTGPGLALLQPDLTEVDLEGEGAWVTPLLPPGDYEMVVVYAQRLKALLDEFDPDWERLDPIARVAFSITDRDADLGTIQDGPFVTVTGRYVMRSADQSAVDLKTLPTVRLFDETMVLFRSADHASDGTFVLDRMLPGSYSFQLDSGTLPENWYVKSVMSGGQDVLRDGLEIGGRVAPVVLTLSGDGARIEGVSRNGREALVPNARIVLIPPAASRGPMTHFVVGSANRSGRWVLAGVPPGDYRLLVVDTAGMPAPAWESPDFLREYELRGERITVDPGARMTINAEAIPIYE